MHEQKFDMETVPKDDGVLVKAIVNEARRNGDGNGTEKLKTLSQIILRAEGKEGLRPMEYQIWRALDICKPLDGD